MKKHPPIEFRKHCNIRETRAGNDLSIRISPQLPCAIMWKALSFYLYPVATNMRQLATQSLEGTATCPQ